MLTFNQLLASSGIAAATELTVSSIANPTELNAVGTAVPDWRLCHQNTAASDQATLYRLDASTDAVNAPYIMASATAGLRWIAIAGRYQNDSKNVQNILTVGASLTVNSAATITGTLAASANLTVASAATITGTLTASSNLAVTSNATVSGTATITGVLTASSSLSVTSAASVTGVLTVSNATDATSLGTGALVLSAGGLSVNNQLRVGGILTSSNTTSATTSLLGAVVVGNGVAATSLGLGGGNVNAGGTIKNNGACVLDSSGAGSSFGGTLSCTSMTASSFISTGASYSVQVTGTTVGQFIANGTYAFIAFDAVNSQGWIRCQAGTTATSVVNIQGTLDATNSTTAAVTLGGGLAVAKSTQIGTTLTTGGGITITNGNGTFNNTAGTANLVINGATANNAQITFQINAVAQTRWLANTTDLQLVDVANSSAVPFDYKMGSTAAGFITYNNTLDATAIGTAAAVYKGGAGFAKNLLSGQGLGWGVTSTATAAGTTVLTTSTAVCQVFTGSTTQTVTLPAANAFGAGVAYVLRIKNVSTGTVTINRAGADTIDGGTSTTLTGGSKQSVDLISDGVSAWYIT